MVEGGGSHLSLQNPVGPWVQEQRFPLVHRGIRMRSECLPDSSGSEEESLLGQ